MVFQRLIAEGPIEYGMLCTHWILLLLLIHEYVKILMIEICREEKKTMNKYRLVSIRAMINVEEISIEN